MKKLKKVINIFIWLGVLYLAFNFFLIYMVPVRYEYFIDDVSKKEGVDKGLILAIIKTESNFNKDSVSPKRAMGLMQIIPETANYISEKYGKKVDLESIFDPYTNVMLGSLYLKELINRFGDENLAILAYNAGPTKVKSWLDEGLVAEGSSDFSRVPYSETKNYGDSVLKAKNNYTKFLKYNYRVPAYLNNLVLDFRIKYNKSFRNIKNFFKGVINEN